jgi:hypothetical protein
VFVGDGIVEVKGDTNMKCPGCNGHGKKTERIGIYECKSCRGVFGQCYLGESYAIVLPIFTTDPTADSRAKYFDFTCLGSKGVTRRHGWFDPQTRLLTQVG